MLQNAMPALILLVIMVALAWALKRWRGHLPGVARQEGPALRVLSALSLGPQQRVVTLRVGDGPDAQCLVLGVAPGGVNTLHTLAWPEAATETHADHASTMPAAGFAARLSQLTKASHDPR